MSPSLSHRNRFIQDKISEIFLEVGLSRWGIAPVGTPQHYPNYIAWIEKGFHGEMEYLKRHLPLKKDPRNLLPTAKCVLMVLAPYAPPHPHHEERWEQVGISLYAQGQDYHLWFKDRLIRATDRLSSLLPEADFLIEMDTGALMERELATQAGLGWIGKNCCLLTSQGSLFFIGAILTSLDLAPSDMVPKPHCGTCTRCLDACPTKALIEPYVMDARRCISYLTIESKSTPSPELLQNWPVTLFGCDICQQVCPWNRKEFPTNSDTVSKPKLISLLRLILTATNRQLFRSLHTWEHSRSTPPLTRAGAHGLKRNALLLVRQLQLKELKEEVVALYDHPRYGELARKTLKTPSC